MASNGNAAASMRTAPSIVPNQRPPRASRKPAGLPKFAGGDPYNKQIDRNSDDNAIKVTAD